MATSTIEPLKPTLVPRKESWSAIIREAARSPLGILALIVLAVIAILEPMAVKASQDHWPLIAMMVLLGIVILSVTFIATYQSLLKKRESTVLEPVNESTDSDKIQLIRDHEDVIDAATPPLSHDDLTAQLQQLRAVIHQAQRYSTPTYYLDTHLSVIHWNVAFDIIFKPILHKIRRKHVNYFIAELANHAAVFDHAREFTNNVRQGQLPLIDVEPLVYESKLYGSVEFEKVASQLTDPEGNLKAWSVALLLKKIDWEMYRPELLQRLRDDKLWGIYAVSYDTILSDFPPYRQLIDDVLRGISPNVGRVLELGAGTGNVTKALLQRGYTVTALENNPFMLDKMCAKKLDQNQRLTINLESAESLDLIEQDNFDAAVAVNVAYAFDDPLGCFRNVAQLLKPNGVFVLSTTHSETDLDPLLKAIESHLKATGTFKEKEEHYRRVVEVNRDIQYSIARRYTREEYEQWLDQAGFRITYEKSSYKDAVIVIHARKVRD